MGDGEPIPLEELTARLRQLRAETFGPKAEPEREVVDVDAPVLRAPEPDVAPPGAVPGPDVAGEPASDDYAVKYAMEIAAHRETTDRLLEEKDQSIRRLEESVSELRAELDRLRFDVRDRDRT